MREIKSGDWENLVQKIDFLDYTNQQLVLEGVTIEQILRNKQTPLFVFSRNRFNNNITEIFSAFQRYFDDFQIAYALKANNLSDVLKNALTNGCWAEVMSTFEIELAQRNGFHPETMIYNGPAKSIEELQDALNRGVKCINVDSFSELKDIETLMRNKEVPKTDIPLKLGIRLHPNLDEDLEKRALVKKNSKLGLDPARATKILKYAKKSNVLDISTLQVHIGTQQTTPELHEGIANFVQKFITKLQKDNIDINTINLGGGFASRYRMEAAGYNILDFAEKIQAALAPLKNSYSLILEPGRFLIGDAFVVLTKILREKKNWGRHWLLIDAGAHFLIPLRFSTFDVIPVKSSEPSTIKEIGGPLCLPVDRIQGTVDFSAKEGDILAILNTGAYTISMSEQFGYPRPAIYAIENGKLIQLRRRERIDDWLSLDI